VKAAVSGSPVCHVLAGFYSAVNNIAQKDGTPIIVNSDGNIGIFYWGNTEGKGGQKQRNRKRKAFWRGVYIITEFNPIVSYENGKETALDGRFIFVEGIDGPFMRKPLPPLGQNPVALDCGNIVRRAA